jgi:hypothetical protein
MPRSKPGKSLEALVSSIERALAGNDKVTVESPKFLPDRITGERREHDVVITLTGSHHKSTIAIECRDRSRKVTVNDVESFWSKCQDTGIDQGIIVSPKGFSKTALTKSLNRGIRCLRLSEASSFNWLLATGISIRHKKMLHTNWTFFPEKDLVPKPTAFTILSKDGEQIPSENLVAAAYQEFQKIPETEFDVGRGTKNIVFTSPGLLLRDDSTGNTYAVIKALAAVDYEVTKEFVPFNLVTYESSPSGDLITDAAVAKVDLGALKGRFMIVYKESEGGRVVFVPDKGP